MFQHSVAMSLGENPFSESPGKDFLNIYKSFDTEENVGGGDNRQETQPGSEWKQLEMRTETGCRGRICLGGPRNFREARAG